mmetsp:Transcript_19566/g.45554  ORF Transcript_19566/g.45554 Transcript_19566/m.45554 type:complete len:242 (-) Transcript_19566:150-875(-)
MAAHASRPATRKLTQFLTTPSKIASALDWKKNGGSILSLNILRDRIGLSVASHPCREENRAVSLDPIALRFKRKSSKELDSSVISQLQDIIQTHLVCGLVVAWPIQKEGRLGAPCGRVLYTLDSLFQSSNSILTANRKFCLWDGLHVEPECEEDKFGRCEVYGRPSFHTPNYVAKSSDFDAPPLESMDVWQDFCQAHWPNHCVPTKEDCTQTILKEQSVQYNDGEWLDHFEENGYIQASAL